MPPARPMLLRHALRATGLLAAAALLSQAHCFYTNQGVSPPHRSFYFPTGLAVSPGRSALYVANSDFDLQFNGGTVQVLDLRRLRARLDPMLAGIRSSEGALDCSTMSTKQCLEKVCAGIPIRDPEGAAANGQACAQSTDCASANCDACVSGVCTGTGKCQQCQKPADCQVGGTCVTDKKSALYGTCVLAVNPNTILTPSACTPILPPYAVGGPAFATIGAFASGAVIAESPMSDGKVRLFVPVRGDPSITWFDVVDDRGTLTADQLKNLDVAKLACGGMGDDQRCFQDHQIGLDPYENLRSLTLPVEPNGLDVSEDGTVVVTAHQIQNGPAVGLTTNLWGQRPAFQFYLSSNVGAGPTEVAHVPVPGIVTRFPSIAYQPGFLVTYNATPEIDLFRYNDDALGRPPRPFLTRASQANVSVNADGKDSRGLVVDPGKRRACEKGCDALGGGPACQVMPDARSCLRCCLDTPLDLYVANRAPPSLLLGHVRTQIVDSDHGGPVGSGAFDVVEIYDSVSLAQGPSKVALGSIIGTDGQLQPRIFTVTFDTKHIFSYDPALRQVDAVISTGRGPHAIAFDTCLENDPDHPCGQDETSHSYLYVGHFTDSYLGVVDLDARHATFGVMFASIGSPTAPRESK